MNPRMIAMSQCYQGKPPGDTSKTSEVNSTMMTWQITITIQTPTNIMFVNMLSNMFFSSLTFLVLIMLKI
jgi:hypothetical protein